MHLVHPAIIDCWSVLPGTAPSPRTDMRPPAPACAAYLYCLPVPQALYDGQYVDAHFTRSFYKHMLGQVRACGW